MKEPVPASDVLIRDATADELFDLIGAPRNRAEHRLMTLAAISRESERGYRNQAMESHVHRTYYEDLARIAFVELRTVVYAILVCREESRQA